MKTVHYLKLAIVNGPNLNLLGVREPHIYGNQSFEDYFEVLKKEFFKIVLEYFQSNVEGELVNYLQKVGFSYDGIIINAGGYTHTSVAIADCIASIETPVVEVHISNPMAREEYRQTSFLTSKCKGVVSGFGLKSYWFAIESFI